MPRSFSTQFLATSTFSLIVLAGTALAQQSDTSQMPTLFLIGDSTVRNGQGDGGNGQWGWGEPLADYFNKTKLQVVNRAIGGRSSRTFLTEGRWDAVLAALKPGDFVMMQFGHNDSGPLDDTSRARGSLPGTGEETREIDNPITKKHEVVHTYGWYLRQYVAGVRSKGAIAIVCSPVPRKIWKDGKIVRASDTYTKWAADVAHAERVSFLDLQEIIATQYDGLGPVKVDPLFADEHTHTSRAGAEWNAAAVVAALKELKPNPLAEYFSERSLRISEAPHAPLRFAFGVDRLAPDMTQVIAATDYSTERGYGWEARTSVECKSSACSSDKPFSFSVTLPEGNYDVEVTLGGASALSDTTVRAESRRLMLESVKTGAGQSATRRFTVNIRTSQITSAESIKIKPREVGKLDWDQKLTLEFTGSNPSVEALKITRTDDAITVYLAGDSTVTDQDAEPWAAWGQMLPRFFGAGIAVANYAESGEALRSFVAEKRLQKILTTIKAGDYLFVQFTHNDQKPGSAHVDPFTTYQEMLRIFIQEAKQRGATPVLVTSMHRRNFDDNGKINNTLSDYPEAMRQTAREAQVALIDLNVMSKAFYEALGPEGSKKAFVHYPAGSFPGQDKELKDDTHFNNYGAYELAKCVIEGIRNAKLGLTKYLVNDVAAFDPAHPDPIESWSLPPSPLPNPAKPEGK